MMMMVMIMLIAMMMKNSHDVDFVDSDGADVDVIDDEVW